MQTEVQSLKQPSRTLLKSTLHVRILQSRGNYLRSVLVGLQFGIMHLPNEIIMCVIVPFFRDIVGIMFDVPRHLILVLQSASLAIYMGFTGVLEATDEPVYVEFEE